MLARAVLVFAVGSSLAGCFSYTSPTVAPPAEIHPPAAARLESASGEGPRQDGIEPRFVSALARYAAELHRLRGAREPPRRMIAGRALLRLADVIELIPGTRRDLAIARAGQQIRLEDARSVLGANLEGEYENAVVHALQAASAALTRVAGGPYRCARDVGANARALHEAVARLAQARTPEREGVLAALEQAERVLLAIYEARVHGAAC